MIKLLRLLRSKINLTFVTDCPVCHDHFYGWHKYAHNVKIGNKTYRIICHRCALRIKKV